MHLDVTSPIPTALLTVSGQGLAQFMSKPKRVKGGDSDEWKLQQDYWIEKDEFAGIDLNDGVFSYE